MLRCVLFALALSALAGCALRHSIAPEDGPPDTGIGSFDAGALPELDAGTPAEPSFDAGSVVGHDAGEPPVDSVEPCRDLGPPPSPDEATALLAWVQEAIVGRWSGTRHSMWDGDQSVTITFRAGGTYEASCEGACTPFYWGSQRPRGPDARYEIDDTTSSGTASGRLWPVFDDPSTGEPYATWSGTVDGLRIDPTGTSLRLRFWDYEGRGPITFDLARRCE